MTMLENRVVWFRSLKRQAAPDEERLIASVSFHDLRHDFAHRALEVGWSLEEVAYHLGQLTTKGLPATQTTLRSEYTATLQWSLFV